MGWVWESGRARTCKRDERVVAQAVLHGREKQCDQRVGEPVVTGTERCGTNGGWVAAWHGDGSAKAAQSATRHNTKTTTRYVHMAVARGASGKISPPIAQGMGPVRRRGTRDRVSGGCGRRVMPHGKQTRTRSKLKERHEQHDEHDGHYAQGLDRAWMSGLVGASTRGPSCEKKREAVPGEDTVMGTRC